MSKSSATTQPVELDELWFYYPNEHEFKMLYGEIFKQHQYYCELEEPTPRILDIGGHIGLSTLYFKSLFPKSQITTFEPLPDLVEYMEKNIAVNRVMDVEIVPAAVSDHAGYETLYIDSEAENHWTSTSSVWKGAWSLHQRTQPIEVPCVTLTKWLEQPVDLLKIDAEGAETRIIQAIRPQLHNVQHLMIEFHANRFHRPEVLVKILQAAGFQLNATFNHKDISIEYLTHRKPSLYFLEGTRK